MANVLVKVLTEQDAELALADLWYEIELHDLATLNVTMEFGEVRQIMFCVATDGPAPAADVLCAWSKVYGGLCLDSMRPRQSIDSSTFEPQSSGFDSASVTSAIGPVAGIDNGSAMKPFEPSLSGLGECGAAIGRQQCSTKDLSD